MTGPSMNWISLACPELRLEGSGGPVSTSPLAGEGPRTCCLQGGWLRDGGSS